MRNLCSKCPHYYEQHGYECDDVDWGCTAFGRDFENCPSFDDDGGNADFEEWGCNETQNRIDYTLNKLKRKSRALCKIGEAKEQRFYLFLFLGGYNMVTAYAIQRKKPQNYTKNRNFKNKQNSAKISTS